jgi:hypothetical protein
MIFDKNVLAQDRRNPGGDEPRHDVGRPARGEGGNELDRLGRERIGSHTAGNRQNSCDRQRKAQTILNL